MAILAVKVIGVLLILAGTLYLINPRLMRKVIDFFSIGTRLYVVGVIRLALGILFLYAASQADIQWIIITIGILMIISAIIIFAMGTKKMCLLLDFYKQQNDTVLRLLSLVALIFGILIIYAA